MPDNDPSPQPLLALWTPDATSIEPILKALRDLRTFRVVHDDYGQIPEYMLPYALDMLDGADPTFGVADVPDYPEVLASLRAWGETVRPGWWAELSVRGLKLDTAAVPNVLGVVTGPPSAASGQAIRAAGGTVLWLAPAGSPPPADVDAVVDTTDRTAEHTALALLIAAAAKPHLRHLDRRAVIDYTNHRGVRRTRSVWPVKHYFAETPHHKPTQWVMDAICVDTDGNTVRRTFAMANIHEWIHHPRGV